MSDQLRDRVVAAIGDTYEVEAEIGRGGMAAVYRARDLRLKRLVAIKVLPPDLAFREEVRTRFLREAQTAAQLNHPNIVPIFSVDERVGLVYFVMALVEGESLGARLARERRPPVNDVTRTLREVADALGYAHARGIVHRDIKPDNILLDAATGRAMVTDFGIARAAEGDSRLTVTGIAVGTPTYMSPEQALGERDVDGRSDQYSLAVVAYQMLTGQPPFAATNTPAMLLKHISEPPAPLSELRPDLPPGLIVAVERGLAKKPTDRWPNAYAFRDALTAEVAALPAPMVVPPPDRLRQSAAWKRAAVPRESAPNALARDNAGRNLPLPGSASRERGGRGLSRAEPWRTPDPNEEVPVPNWMPASWQDVRRHQRAAQRAERRSQRERDTLHAFGELPIEEKIRRFRRKLAGYATTVAVLGIINSVFTPFFPWVIFPAIGMGIGLIGRAASLWADGVRFRQVFGREARQALQRANERPGNAKARLASGGRTPVDESERLAPSDVLRGRYGDVVRRAAYDRVAVHEAVAKLSKVDREMIPDVAPTVDALAERVGALAQALHRMDTDITPESLAALDARIEETSKRPESRERDQRLELLQRQRVTMNDLLTRHETLLTQLESASLMLQNMRLDLIALRSAGVQSAIDDVLTATQEARALSRDIAHVLDAARQVR
ncbi:MAG TPA: protein kinase [Gemmatimonadaceae bacterium]|nr:protein kinase [Gemmatimonadaceae bacterium]